MNEETAIALLRRQMRELGIAAYLLRYRHLKIGAAETREIKARDQFFYLVNSPVSVKIESKAGIYDSKPNSINELQHVHRGTITIHNTGAVAVEVKFIQVIPKIIKNQNEDGSI